MGFSQLPTSPGKPLAWLVHLRGCNFLYSCTDDHNEGHWPSRVSRKFVRRGNKLNREVYRVLARVTGQSGRHQFRGTLHDEYSRHGIVYFDLLDSLSTAPVCDEGAQCLGLRDFDGEFMARASSLLGLHKYKVVR